MVESSMFRFVIHTNLFEFILWGFIAVVCVMAVWQGRGKTR